MQTMTERTNHCQWLRQRNRNSLMENSSVCSVCAMLCCVSVLSVAIIVGNYFFVSDTIIVAIVSGRVVSEVQKVME